MNYSHEEFVRLMEAVEDQGGRHLDETCSPKRYEFCGDKIKPVTLKGCNNESLFEVPYAATSADGRERGTMPVRVCAVDDDMGSWPRFRDEVFDD